MIAQTLYITGGIVLSPVLPFMALQGKKIRANMQDLPDAAPPYEGEVGDSGHRLRILGLGESTIAGVGVEQMEQSITAHIARHLQRQLDCPFQWEVIGRSGYTAQKVSEELVPLIPSQDYDLIVIGLGGNDTFLLTSPRQWQKSIQELITCIRRQGHKSPILFINVPPVHEFLVFPWHFKLVLGRLVRLHSYVLKQVAYRADQVHYMQDKIHLSDMMQRVPYPTQPTDYFSDGVHPSELTYRLWAQQIAEFILERQLIG
ncbi:MAG: SGNH/GDSL hydrolase family protein [Bacteroidota bacterium]